MSDADYAAFLKKSQKDYSQPSEGVPAATSTTATSEAHPAIKALGERYYTSEADEPFEGISYDWENETLPDEGLCAFLHAYLFTSDSVAFFIVPQYLVKSTTHKRSRSREKTSELVTFAGMILRTTPENSSCNSYSLVW